jgi:hypothetical protein
MFVVQRAGMTMIIEDRYEVPPSAATSIGRATDRVRRIPAGDVTRLRGNLALWVMARSTRWHLRTGFAISDEAKR